MRFTLFSGQRVWWLLAVVTGGWLLLMTLRSDGHISAHDINLVPLAEHSLALLCLINHNCVSPGAAFRFLLINLLGNILVFIPLGLGLAGALDRGRLRRAMWQATLGGFVLSLTIELLQLATPSRSTDIDDLIFNTLGTALGVCLYVLFKIYFTRRFDRTV